MNTGRASRVTRSSGMPVSLVGASQRDVGTTVSAMRCSSGSRSIDASRLRRPATPGRRRGGFAADMHAPMKDRKTVNGMESNGMKTFQGPGWGAGTQLPNGRIPCTRTERCTLSIGDRAGSSNRPASSSRDGKRLESSRLSGSGGDRMPRTPTSCRRGDVSGRNLEQTP